MQGNGHRPLWLGLLGLLAIALGLHLWGLGWFNSLVFDEVYYVPFALKYLKLEPLFDAHPPLGKYLIALGIALGQSPANGLGWPTTPVEGQLLSPLSYRWLNALAGTTLPLITALLAFHLSPAYSLGRRLGFSLLAGGLMVVEGLTLVESRLALINIYWVWLGLWGQLCWVRAVGPASVRWRVAAGMALGAAVSVKWNGAGFWLGIVLLEVLWRWRLPPKHVKPSLAWKPLVIYLGLIPLAVYTLLWLPHLWINQVSLIDIHRQLWMAHQTIGDVPDPHPYCSAWYTWPLMLRPVSYFYQRVIGPPPEAILAPELPGGPATYTVQGMGNPILWWLAMAAVLSLGLGQLSRWWGRPGGPLGFALNRYYGKPVAPALPLGQNRARLTGPLPPSPVVSFVLVNYAANWLPWLVVGRCTFLYHALGLVVFGSLALAWLLSRWLLDPRWHYRAMAMAMVLATLWGFWFWLPIWIGLPLSPDALQQRWWLKTWI